VPGKDHQKRMAVPTAQFPTAILNNSRIIVYKGIAFAK
jgi:hypothetical protein